MKLGHVHQLDAGHAFPPGLTAGGGLKLVSEHRAVELDLFSPGLTAGGGLKRSGRRRYPPAACFPRPHRRGRIETNFATTGNSGGWGFPRPHRRGRIETWLSRAVRSSFCFPPGLTAGGGLKQLVQASPEIAVVSPGLTAGGGLKLEPGQAVGFTVGFPPASPPGAD